MKEKFNPLVSIIIPVYNGANFVKDAIDSCLTQTYKNIEIVVVNDGSKDNTEEIIKEYGNKVRYFKKENGGVATALNYGITKSKGQYFSWLSHDDVYYPSKITQQVDALRKLPRKEQLETILYSNYSSINEKGELLGSSEFEKQFSSDKLNYPFFPLLNGLIHGCALLIPKKCFEKVGLFDIKLRATQDYALWFKMFPQYKLLFQANPTIKSRTHGAQDSKKVVSNEECDMLWIHMMNNLKREQINFMSGGLLPFYKNTLRIVTDAHYQGAVEFIELKINEYKSRNADDILVSVIIPFQNRIAYTIEALESVLNQSHKKIEVILVDDNSNEDATKLSKIVSRDKRIVIIKNGVQSGAAISRNNGINIAQGEFIAFLDSDDLFFQGKIERQLEFMLSKGIMVSHTSYELFDDKESKRESMLVGKIDYTFPYIVANCGIATPTVMAHRDVFFDPENRFPENMDVSEDLCMWTRLARNHVIVGISDVLTSVRKHDKRAADDPIVQIKGLRNRLDYCALHFMSDIIKPELEVLNKLIYKQTVQAYGLDLLPEEILDRVNQTFMGRIKIRLKKLIIKLLGYLPHYRKIRQIEIETRDNNHKMEKLSESLDELMLKTIVTQAKLDKRINSLTKKKLN